MTIRQNVAAAIVRDGQILLSAYEDATGLHYNYPGGGIEPGESALDAVRREVHEETGATVAHIGRLLLAWEYVPALDGAKYGNTQKVGLIFECTIDDFDAPLVPAQPTAHQIGAHWLPLNQLETVSVLPHITRPLLDALHAVHAGASFITHF